MPLMPAPILRWFVPAQPGTGGGLVPAAQYKAKFYKSGTNIAQAVYTDAALTVPFPSPSNVAEFDAEGKVLVYLSNGISYRMQITDPSDVIIYTQDSIIGGSGGLSSAVAPSFDDLKSVDTDLNQFCFIPGYRNEGDGGHGMFYVGPVDTPDGGYTQSSTFDPSKSWFRIPDENSQVRAASFGFIQATAAVQTSELQAADAYAASKGLPLFIDVGQDLAEVDAMTFNAPKIVFAGKGLYGINTSPTLTFSGLVEAPPAFLFNRMTAVLNHPAQSLVPEWWNTTKDGATDDLAKLDAMFANNGKKYQLASGDYEVSAAPTFPSSGYILSLGTITEGVTTHLSPGLWVLDSNGLVKAQTLEAVLNIVAGGDITVGGVANVGSSANVDFNVSAGEEGAGNSGYLEGRSGTSTKKFRAGGLVISERTRTTAVGGSLGRQVLILADMLEKDGDTFRLVVEGAYGTTGNVLTLDIDSTNVITNSLTSGSTLWRIEIEIVRYSSSTVRVTGFDITSKGTDPNLDLVGFVEVTGLDFTSNITIDIDLTGGGGGTTNEMGPMYAEYLPAPV